ncbi:MAG: rRNA maturation RNase YbeY [Rhodospirillales bacterium]|nr:rRNA maturation RNase YbeY [Rhodospirillales bacterium]MCW9003440.1 rRNA maturation RNase YbeY [Rhodospirillales bacterium]
MTAEDEIGIDVACARWNDTLPGCQALSHVAAVAAVAAARTEPGSPIFPLGARSVEASIMLTDDAAVRELNRDYRGKDAPTNVLSFSALEDEDGSMPDRITLPEGAPVVLGDVVVALETTVGEAAAEGKSTADHLSHLIVHGILHLLGCRHETETEAEYMEGLETRILREMGIADPYSRAEGK